MVSEAQIQMSMALSIEEGTQLTTTEKAFDVTATEAAVKNNLNEIIGRTYQQSPHSLNLTNVSDSVRAMTKNLAFGDDLHVGVYLDVLRQAEKLAAGTASTVLALLNNHMGHGGPPNIRQRMYDWHVRLSQDKSFALQPMQDPALHQQQSGFHNETMNRKYTLQ